MKPLACLSEPPLSLPCPLSSPSALIWWTAEITFNPDWTVDVLLSAAVYSQHSWLPFCFLFFFFVTANTLFCFLFIIFFWGHKSSGRMQLHSVLYALLKKICVPASRFVFVAKDMSPTKAHLGVTHWLHPYDHFHHFKKFISGISWNNTYLWNLKGTKTGCDCILCDEETPQI